MNLKLRRRLESLEKRLTSGAIVLQMPDGSQHYLRGRRNYASRMLGWALRGEWTPEMKLIAQSVSSIEPGNGKLVELAMALIGSPGWEKP
jgi:hypothetical protein